MKPMLFSVSYAGYWGQHRLGVVEFIEKAAALGYSSVEIGGKRPHLSVLDYPDDASLEAIAAAAKRSKIEIGTIAAYTNFTAGKESFEVPLVEMQVLYIQQLARIAKALGAKIVRIFSGYFTEPQRWQADWERSVEAVRACGEAAAPYGVTIGLQNHHDIGVSVEAYEEFLGDVAHPNVKAMFDPWSIALVGADLYQAARRLAPQMVQTTLADYVILDRFAYQPHLVNFQRLDPPAVRAVPLGQGFIDLDAFFAGLKEGGFDGYVAYEMCSPLRGGGSEANLDRTARESLDEIKRLAGA